MIVGHAQSDTALVGSAGKYEDSRIEPPTPSREKETPIYSLTELLLMDQRLVVKIEQAANLEMKVYLMEEQTRLLEKIIERLQALN